MIDTIYIHQPKDPHDDPYLHLWEPDIACPVCGGDDLEYFREKLIDKAMCNNCGFQSGADKFIKNR